MSRGQLVIKKEKATPSLPPKKAVVDLTIKTLGAKKRKSSEALDLSLDDLGAEEAMQRLSSFSQAVSDHVSRSLEELKIRAEEAERTLKLKEENWKAIKKDLLAKVEKEKAKKEEEHAQEIEDVIVELKSSAAQAIWEAKIKMAEDVEEGNVGSWDLAGWRDALAKLTDRYVEVSQDSAEKKKKKGGEEEKKKGEEGAVKS